MLVLRRKWREKVIIHAGQDVIEIQVVEVRDGAARLGFVAPKHITIDREEIYLERSKNERPYHPG